MKLRTLIFVLITLVVVPSSFAFDVESRLAKSIRERLEQVENLSAHEIIIEDRRGSITLSGFVSSALDEERVVSSVREVRGVSEVINQLEIRPRASATPVPGGLAERVQQAVGSKVTFTGPYRIDIRVAEGVVTLTGSVMTEAESAQAKTVAESVSGVKKVINKIVVQVPAGG